uniref:Uncharacterized protein n=1 Tax=Chromera velia CCMP2878 TaxID=1169474 RepID=A0A0G4GCC5_9ALVE|eukprot:Cvel_4516.t1-p1 / transcript=Cvel_4516.t1 / gene=Cvel_4516 / organism=Chromera_velia_CCMP2878 / gene_product=hypothetical protein / transcript_product=hypothetical protein / location=Cvel_scaffold197:108201-115412(+) / protein_length=1654 / sequence_SO=supercontig / SO=protein_coding / is_pseudo=false
MKDPCTPTTRPTAVGQTAGTVSSRAHEHQESQDRPLTKESACPVEAEGGASAEGPPPLPAGPTQSRRGMCPSTSHQSPCESVCGSTRRAGEEEGEARRGDGKESRQESLKDASFGNSHFFEEEKGEAAPEADKKQTAQNRQASRGKQRGTLTVHPSPLSPSDSEKDEHEQKTEKKDKDKAQKARSSVALPHSTNSLADHSHTQAHCHQRQKEKPEPTAAPAPAHPWPLPLPPPSSHIVPPPPGQWFPHPPSSHCQPPRPHGPPHSLTPSHVFPQRPQMWAHPAHHFPRPMSTFTPGAPPQPSQGAWPGGNQHVPPPPMQSFGAPVCVAAWRQCQAVPKTVSDLRSVMGGMGTQRVPPRQVEGRGLDLSSASGCVPVSSSSLLEAGREGRIEHVDWAGGPEGEVVDVDREEEQQEEKHTEEKEEEETVKGQVAGTGEEDVGPNPSSSSSTSQQQTFVEMAEDRARRVLRLLELRKVSDSSSSVPPTTNEAKATEGERGNRKEKIEEEPKGEEQAQHACIDATLPSPPSANQKTGRQEKKKKKPSAPPSAPTPEDTDPQSLHPPSSTPTPTSASAPKSKSKKAKKPGSRPVSAVSSSSLAQREVEAIHPEVSSSVNSSSHFPLEDTEREQQEGERGTMEVSTTKAHKESAPKLQKKKKKASSGGTPPTSAMKTSSPPSATPPETPQADDLSPQMPSSAFVTPTRTKTAGGKGEERKKKTEKRKEKAEEEGEQSSNESTDSLRALLRSCRALREATDKRRERDAEEYAYARAQAEMGGFGGGARARAVGWHDVERSQEWEAQSVLFSPLSFPASCPRPSVHAHALLTPPPAQRGAGRLLNSSATFHHTSAHHSVSSRGPGKAIPRVPSFSPSEEHRDEFFVPPVSSSLCFSAECHDRQRQTERNAIPPQHPHACTTPPSPPLESSRQQKDKQRKRHAQQPDSGEVGDRETAAAADPEGSSGRAHGGGTSVTPAVSSEPKKNPKTKGSGQKKAKAQAAKPEGPRTPGPSNSSAEAVPPSPQEPRKRRANTPQQSTPGRKTNERGDDVRNIKQKGKKNLPLASRPSTPASRPSSGPSASSVTTSLGSTVLLRRSVSRGGCRDSIGEGFGRVSSGKEKGKVGTSAQKGDKGKKLTSPASAPAAGKPRQSKSSAEENPDRAPIVKTGKRKLMPKKRPSSAAAAISLGSASSSAAVVRGKEKEKVERLFQHGQREKKNLKGGTSPAVPPSAPPKPKVKAKPKSASEAARRGARQNAKGREGEGTFCDSAVQCEEDPWAIPPQSFRDSVTLTETAIQADSAPEAEEEPKGNSGLGLRGEASARPSSSSSSAAVVPIDDERLRVELSGGGQGETAFLQSNVSERETEKERAGERNLEEPVPFLPLPLTGVDSGSEIDDESLRAALLSLPPSSSVEAGEVARLSSLLEARERAARRREQQGEEGEEEVGDQHPAGRLVDSCEGLLDDVELRLLMARLRSRCREFGPGGVGGEMEIPLHEVGGREGDRLSLQIFVSPSNTPKDGDGGCSENREGEGEGGTPSSSSNVPSRFVLPQSRCVEKAKETLEEQRKGAAGMHHRGMGVSSGRSRQVAAGGRGKEEEKEREKGRVRPCQTGSSSSSSSFSTAEAEGDVRVEGGSSLPTRVPSLSLLSLNEERRKKTLKQEIN